AELADDLERWLAGEPIRARPTRSIERVVRWVRRRPVAAALLAVSFAAAVVLVFLLVERRSRQELEALNNQLRDANDEAERQRRRAVEQEETARRFQYAADLQMIDRSLTDLRYAGDLDRVLELLERQRPKTGQSDLRGLEWYILWRRCHRASATLLGTPYVGGAKPQIDSFVSVAFSKDGHDVVVGSAAGSIQVWDPEQGKSRALLSRGKEFDI